MNSKKYLLIGFILFTGILLLRGDQAKKNSPEITEPMIAGFSNPAAEYCMSLGYDYNIEGDAGVCVFPDETSCEAWDFLNGKCGNEHSYCAQNGWDVQVKTDGNNAYSEEYAVCVDKNKSEVGTVSSLTNLAELSTADCQREFLPVDSIQERKTYPEEIIATAPTSFDWRNQPEGNFVTGVRDQGGCGSCWAFSVIAVTEAAYNIANGTVGNNYDLSEQYLISDCSNAGACCGGYQFTALEFIQENGVPDEACMPYVDGYGCSCNNNCSNCSYYTGTCSTGTCGSCSDRTCGDRCSDYASRLTDIGSYMWVNENTEDIKQALIDSGPLSVFMTYNGYWDGDIYRCNESGYYENHIVTIVGYDDADSAWIVKNSWGTGFGDNGYFKLGYEECYVNEQVYGVTPFSSSDSYEEDNIAEQANLITNGETQTHSISPIGDRDWVKFSLSSESEVILETSGSGYDTRMWLYDDSISLVDFDDDDGDGYFSKVVRSCGVNALPAGTYYAEIDEYGNNGEIPSYNISLQASSCTVDQPEAPSLTAPSSNAVLYECQPGFSWSDVTNASHYEIAVFAYGSNGTNISGTPLTAAYTPPSVLRPDWYYWRARAWDGTTAGVWSNDSWFKINIGAPNNVTPVTNDGTYNLTPTFDWSDVCGADGYDLYAVRYDETGTPQTAIYTGTTASEYTPPSNLTPGIYAWYVRAKSGTEYGPWNTFYWLTLFIGAPNLQTPVTNDLVTPYPEFIWTTLAGATGYDLFVVKIAGEGNTTAMYEEYIPTTSYTDPDPLDSGIYAWYVRARAGHWVGPWTNFYWFVVP